MRLKKWRQVRLRQVSALVSMGTFCLMNLPFQRVSAADVLHPVSQAHADLREVESESRRSHMKHQLEKQKAANARACCKRITAPWTARAVAAFGLSS